MNKVDFVKKLEEVIRLADDSVEALTLTEDEDEVVIEYGTGRRKVVNIAGDSKLAIILDVTKKCLY